MGMAMHSPLELPCALAMARWTVPTLARLAALSPAFPHELLLSRAGRVRRGVRRVERLVRMMLQVRLCSAKQLHVGSGERYPLASATNSITSTIMSSRTCKQGAFRSTSARLLASRDAKCDIRVARFCAMRAEYV